MTVALTSALRLFVFSDTTIMTSYRTYSTPVDSKKEEFRKYLEESGVLEKLTRALVSLFEEQDRPKNGVAYIRARLGSDGAEASADAMKQELDQVRKQLEDLQLEHNELKLQLTKGEVEEAMIAEPEP